MAFEKNSGENSKQMSLDLGKKYVPKSISNILNDVSKIDDLSKKSSKLKFHIQSLEEEVKKIEAFKRELPQCMILLKDAIERLELEEERLQIKLKGKFEVGVGAKGSNDFSEKKTWMSSVQLWSTPIQYDNNKNEANNQDSVFTARSRCEMDKGSGSGIGNMKNRGGAFVPFKRPSGVTIKEDKRAAPVHGLSFSVAETEVEGRVKEKRVLTRPQLDEPQNQQQQKKQRRCWSSELHNSFVNALQVLGGPHHATPKQIRELMNVDGLTNDEVKSHLQKFRIHIKKLPAGSSSLAWMNDPVSYSESPQDHLDIGGSSKGGSTVGGDSMDEEENDKFESYSCMGWAQNHVQYHA